MSSSPLRAVSPLDGRYASQTAPLADYFSEWALIRYRVLVEVEWLLALPGAAEIGTVRPFAPGEIVFLRQIVDGFGDEDAQRVKEIERTTNHDVKAVEYFV